MKNVQFFDEHIFYENKEGYFFEKLVRKSNHCYHNNDPTTSFFSSCLASTLL